jgi:hypothetical protein
LLRDLALSLKREGKNEDAIENLGKAIELGLGERFESVAKILLEQWRRIN